MNEPVAALLSFNQARKDSVWGERALFKMVQICINPDNDTIGEGMDQGDIVNLPDFFP